MEPTADEMKRLQGCINDLISVLALPAIWSGHESSQIVNTLLDVLLGMLRLDFAYARLSDAIGGSPIEVVRLAQRRHLAAQPQEVGRALNRWLTGDPPTSPVVVPNPIGAGEVSIAIFRLGLQDTVGVLVAGSQRADFPTTIDMLLLRVAANQAAIELQEARRLREQRQAAEEIRFQAGLLDAVDQAVIAANIHGVITYWNRYAERLYGWSAPEVIGRNMMDIIPAQGSTRAAAEMLSRWQRGERWMGECLVHHRDGRIFPALVIASPISNSQEVLIGVVEVSIDITERKRAEEELEQRVAERTRQLTAVNEELRQEIIERKRAEEESRTLASLVEHSTDFIGIVSLDGQVLFVNPAGQQMLGLEGNEHVRATRVLDYVAEPNRTRFQERVLPAVMQHGRWEGETRFRHFKTGATIPMLQHIFFITEQGSDRPVALATISRDFTELKRAEEALRKSERQFHALFDEAAVGIALVNVTGQAFESNPKLQQMLGYSEEEFRGMPFTQITHPDDVQLDWHLFTELVSGKRDQYQLEKRYYRKDGTLVWGNLTMSLVRDERGEPLFGMGMVEDITERKRAEEALRQTQAALAHLSRVMTMGELTASITHEVNQPLAAVVTNGNACLRWLARAEPDLAEARAAVERMIRDGHRASEVIRRIRALAQKTDPQQAWLDLNDIIHEVLALVYSEVLTLVHSEVRTQRVSLRADLSSALPTVLGDRIQLQQVVLNLLINGIEAMQAVTDRARELQIRSQRHDADHVLVAVQDSGIGLDPQQLARLFDAFFTTKAGGMGMGLAISRSIIEAHGGRIWATANDGRGATFQFVLPVDPVKLS